MEPVVQIHYPKESPENLFIRQIWSTKEILPVTRKEKILPKGTAEIIFNLSGDIYGYKSEEEHTFSLPKCFINGLNFSPVHLSAKTTLYFVGIQINTFALKYLFKTPAPVFNDQIFEGSLLCKSLDELTEQLVNSNSFQEQVAFIFKWFRGKIKDFSAAEAKSRIISLHSDPDIIQISVKELSERYNVTPRHLSRICNEYFGTGTEGFILYRKYLSSLSQVHQIRDSLTTISYDCGFYDQSHFVRTFKLFTGLTPGQYRTSMGHLPGHIFEFSEG